MKKAVALLIMLALTPSVYAMGSTGERACLNKTWQKPFVCGKDNYIKAGKGLLNPQQLNEFIACVEAHKQNCCEKHKPGTTWNQDSDTCKA